MNAGGLLRPCLLSLGDAVRAVRTIGPLARGPNPYPGPWADAGSELEDLKRVLSALPAGWEAAAAAATPATPGPLEAYMQSDGLSSRLYRRDPTDHELQVDCSLVSGLGWYLGSRATAISGLSVRRATGLQMSPWFAFAHAVSPGLC
jgi:hypothetical protein